MAADPSSVNERFYRLIWPHSADVLRAVRVLCGNTADAEELAQETLLKSFVAIDSFRVGSNALPWLMRILRNCRIDRLRVRGLPGVSLEASELDPPARDETLGDDWKHPQQILNRFSDPEIIDALRALPEEIRHTLLLVNVQGLDHAEAASILEVPVGTIKSRAFRGRQMLRARLTQVVQTLSELE